MSAETYLDNTGRDDILGGGARMIPIHTPKGDFHVWTKRFGNNPTAKLLLLHGGPAATHEYFEACDSYLPAAGIEYYYYDQLGSAYSDQPDEPELWQIDRFVDEVEQVRIALGLDAGNFFLLGHSWGGILATEYALRYQAQPERAGHLQHDDEHPRVQRVRTECADARDGSGRARGDPAPRGRR